VITADIVLGNAEVGIEMERNHGAEGVCGSGDTIIAAIEGAGGSGSGRWAPMWWTGVREHERGQG